MCTCGAPGKLGQKRVYLLQQQGGNHSLVHARHAGDGPVVYLCGVYILFVKIQHRLALTSTGQELR